MDVAKKMALDRPGHGFIKFAGLTDKEQQKLDRLAAAAIEEGFNARLAK